MKIPDEYNPFMALPTLQDSNDRGTLLFLKKGIYTTAILAFSHTTTDW